MNIHRYRSIGGVLLAMVLASCASTPDNSEALREAFQASNPKSILVVPSVNQSLFVDAPNYLLSSLSIPLANRGYYVFPVNTVKVVLEQEGLYEPEKVHQLEPAKLAAMFGADAVLYVTIVQWTAEYVVVSTRVTVELDYRMVDKANTDIWKAHKTMTYTPQQSSTGNAFADLIGTLITAAATRVAPNYMPLVNQANMDVLVNERTALPLGPYFHLPD